MSENRYQSGEEPRVGDLVERVDTEGAGIDLVSSGAKRRVNRFELGYRNKWYIHVDEGGFFPQQFKLIERADNGCPVKIGNKLSHVGSKRVGIVQELVRWVHPTTREVGYDAIVARPDTDKGLRGRDRRWDLRRCTVVADNSGSCIGASTTESYPYYVVNQTFGPWRWMGDNSNSDYYVLRVNGPRQAEYLYNDGKVRPVLYENLDLKRHLTDGTWRRVDANPFERGTFIGINTETGASVYANDLKQEPESQISELDVARGLCRQQLNTIDLLRKENNTLRDQLDTVIRERDDEKLINNGRLRNLNFANTRLAETRQSLTNHINEVKEVRKERDEAIQAADKLQDQLNELRDELSKYKMIANAAKDHVDASNRLRDLVKYA